jgi:hypothetical protein
MSSLHHKWCDNCKKNTVHDAGKCIECTISRKFEPPPPQKNPPDPKQD